jgi:hypothetical protein
MGAIARAAANNITTSGVFTADAITNASVTGITVLANAEDGITLISSQTASASASISFTTGIDSTYKAYKFVFVNLHNSAQGNFTFQGSTDSGSNYGVTITSTAFYTYHREDDSETTLAYDTGGDLAQSTSFQYLYGNAGTQNDSGNVGELTIFNPSSTTYVKHFIAKFNYMSFHDTPYTFNYYIAGYFNTTSAINAIQFKMSSGNIDDGTIYMYGIK